MFRFRVWIVKIQFIMGNMVKTQVLRVFMVNPPGFFQAISIGRHSVGCYWPRRCPSKTSLGTAMVSAWGRKHQLWGNSMTRLSKHLKTMTYLGLRKWDDLLFFKYQRIIIFMFENSWGNASGQHFALIWGEVFRHPHGSCQWRRVFTCKRRDIISRNRGNQWYIERNIWVLWVSIGFDRIFYPISWYQLARSRGFVLDLSWSIHFSSRKNGINHFTNC